MTPIDFCKNSLTLTVKEKQYVNDSYNNLVSHVYERILKCNVICNVYIGGSLALGEPSVIIRDGEIVGLHSDIDFFIVVQNITDANAIIEIFQSLESIEADISRSIHITPVIKIPENLCFPSVDDLLYATKKPVLTKFDITNMLPDLVRNPKTMANLFVCRFGLVSLPYYITSHQYSSLAENKQLTGKLDQLKAIFTGLRLQFYGVIENLHGINDTIKQISTGMFDNLLDRDVIQQLLFLREKYDEEQPLPMINFYQFYRRVWINKLSLDEKITDINLANTIIETFFDSPLVLDYLLGLLTLLNFVALSKNNSLYLSINKYLKYELSAEILIVQDKLSLFIASKQYSQEEFVPILMEVHRLTLQEHTNMLKTLLK